MYKLQKICCSRCKLRVWKEAFFLLFFETQRPDIDESSKKPHPLQGTRIQAWERILGLKFLKDMEYKNEQETTCDSDPHVVCCGSK
jgi:hypothetical protein